MTCFCVSTFRMYNAIHTQMVPTTNLCGGVTSTADFQNYTSRIFSSVKKSRISLHILTPILAIDNIVWIDKLLYVQVSKRSEKKKSPNSRKNEGNRTKQFYKKLEPKINAGYWDKTDGPRDELQGYPFLLFIPCAFP